MEKRGPDAQKNVRVVVVAAPEMKTTEEQELTAEANTVRIHAPVQTSVVVEEAAGER